jgi:hypothetical protein
MIPRGIRNNNPGNLTKTSIKWKGKVPHSENTDSRFEQFRDTNGVEGIVWGIRAMIMDIRSDIVKKKQDTIRKLITSYAPSFENNTIAYINAVAKRTGIDADERLIPDINTLSRITEAISFHENGGSYITMDQIHNAWGLL